MKIKALFLLVTLMPMGVAAQQHFSCSWGDRGACLGYGETVCSSSGKCVSSDAVCFDSYQCNYEGFTCKSNVTECVDSYNRLLADNNDLVAEFNDLLDKNRTVAIALKTVTAERDGLEENLYDIQSCLSRATTLDDAQSCRWR